MQSIEGIIKASKEDLVLCPGLGPQKVRVLERRTETRVTVLERRTETRVTVLERRGGLRPG